MIDTYVAELGRALHGPRAARADLLAEAHDGLVDAADAYEECGLAREEAERRAVEEFGPVRVVAPGYQAELGLAQGRRTAVLICAVLVLQPVMWWLLQAFAGTQSGQAGGRGYEVADVAVRWAGGLALATGIAVLLVAGVGVRYLGVRRVVARLTGFFAFAVCGVFAVLGVLMTLGATAPGALLGLTGLPVTLVVLGIPLAAIGLSGRRCLRAA